MEGGKGTGHPLLRIARSASTTSNGHEQTNLEQTGFLFRFSPHLFRSLFHTLLVFFSSFFFFLSFLFSNAYFFDIFLRFCLFSCHAFPIRCFCFCFNPIRCFLLESDGQLCFHDSCCCFEEGARKRWFHGSIGVGEIDRKEVFQCSPSPRSGFARFLSVVLIIQSNRKGKLEKVKGR